MYQSPMHQSEARTAATVWNWSIWEDIVPRGSSGRSLLFFVPYFSARLDFLSPPLSAPGSPRMYDVVIGDPLVVEVKWRYRQHCGQFCT